MTSRKREGLLRPRSGFTLTETLIVLVVLGLITMIGFPRISAAMIKSDLRSARTTVINLVATARAASVQTGRRTWLKFEGGNAYVLARPRQAVGAGDADTVGSVQNLTSMYGVSVVGVDSLQFDPRGFGANFGDTTVVTLSRYSHAETVTLDGLGKVVK